MRFERLDLTRYGLFTDFSIPFGAKPDGPDLHIIYGPNEAGKSTTFSAIVDLLYGIDTRTPYNFKHPYQTMQIGGLVEFNGEAKHFLRVKRPSNSLLDRLENPISDSSILADLGGFDRHAFTTMFSLDDKTLEEGGKNILASKSDFGELLFGASSGLAALSQSLLSVREECDRIFAPRGRSHEISTLKKELDQLKAERDRLDTAASKYSGLVADVQRLQELYEEATAGVARDQTRLNELQGLVRAHPKYQQLLAVRTEIAPLSDIKDAPEGWGQLSTDLMSKAAGTAKELELKRKAVNGAKDELAAIEIDEVILSRSVEIDGLAPLKTRYDTSSIDLPLVRDERATVQGAVVSILAQLGRPQAEDPGALLLPRQTRNDLQRLALERSNLETRVRSCKSEVDVAKLEVTQLKAQSDGGTVGSALDDAMRQPLAAAVEACRNSDHAARAQLADDDRADRAEEVSNLLKGLAPWSGTAEELEKLSVPDPWTVERWVSTWDDAISRRDDLAKDVERLEESKADFAAQLDVFRRDAGLLTDAEAEEVRGTREEAWQLHRSVLDVQSADTFEAAMRRDDDAGAKRFAKVSDLAQVTNLSVQAASVEARLTNAQSRMAAVAREVTDLRATIVAATEEISNRFPADFEVGQLSNWLQLRETAMATHQTSERSAARARAAREEGEGLKAALAEALSAAAIDFDAAMEPGRLLQLGGQVLERDIEAKAFKAQMDRAERNVQSRQRDFEAAQQETDDWVEAWAAICAACWLGGAGATPTVAVVQDALQHLEALSERLIERTGFDDRIAAMEKAQKSYEEAVVAIAASVGLALDGSAARAGLALIERLSANRQKVEAQKAVKVRLDVLERERDALIESVAILEQQSESMRTHFAVESQAEVSEKFAALTRRAELENQGRSYEQEILTLVDLGVVAEAETRLGALLVDEAKTEIERLKSALEDGRAAAQDHFAELRAAKDVLSAVGGDAEVAKLEEQRRTVLLQIDDLARRWMRLKFGVMAAEQGLRLYRDQHRTSLLLKASEAFSIVSRQTYTGLTTQPDRDTEVLVAKHEDGSSKLASELSKGTRFQLYLALRVAGYEDFVASRRPVPFIADDILETFDDGRAEETFRVFSQMALSGQVIYLTHHKHLIGIAREVCPSVTVHELPTR